MPAVASGLAGGPAAAPKAPGGCKGILPQMKTRPGSVVRAGAGV